VLHLIKLCVGPKDVAQLAALQAERLRTTPPLRAWTRMAPKRAAEITAGGSIYWVIAGFVRVRQRVLAIEPAEWDDGTPCVALVLDAQLVPLVARAQKPFQGWRYLTPADAPADLPSGAVPPVGLEALPAGLRRELEGLALL
jgi:hypothetical protein